MVGEDRRELERLSGNLVRGMVYPFGNYLARLISLPITRKVIKNTSDFMVPDCIPMGILAERLA
ncbi:MAG: hypothetical protein WCN92_12815 [Eubacteriales bacterium]